MKGYSQPEAATTHEFSKVKTFWGDAFKFDDETAHFVFADSDTVVVSPQDVANMCRDHGMSLRAAAAYFHTSPSTLLRFMRKNGYSFSQRTEIVGGQG